jgi:hypothetical protein
MKNADSFIRDALTRPHSPEERADPDFIVSYKCERCGKIGMGPRKHLREAVQEHLASCRVLMTKPESVLRLYYPRS